MQSFMSNTISQPCRCYRWPLKAICNTLIMRSRSPNLTVAYLHKTLITVTFLNYLYLAKESIYEFCVTISKLVHKFDDSRLRCLLELVILCSAQSIYLQLLSKKSLASISFTSKTRQCAQHTWQYPRFSSDRG